MTPAVPETQISEERRRNTTIGVAFDRFVSIRTEIIPHNFWYYANISTTFISIVLTSISTYFYTNNEPIWFVATKVNNAILGFVVMVGIQYSNYRAHYPKSQIGETICYSYTRNTSGVLRVSNMPLPTTDKNKS